MEIMPLEKDNQTEVIDLAVQVLKDGGIVIYPTETCYGIGVDATNKDAVDRLFKYKSRREGKPISVAVTDGKMASQYVEINEIAQNLYDNYLPGPLTVVSKGLGSVAEGVESEFGTLGIRIPDYELILKIVEKFGKPVTSTSANASYKKRPYKISDILENISKKQQDLVDLVIDAGTLPPNKPSTVVDTTLNNLNVMRSGANAFQESISKSDILLEADTDTQEQTIDFGSLVLLKFIDEVIDRPLVFALKGELGAGKTQFAKGVARSLKVQDDITSPTYTIIDEYSYKLGERKGLFVHMDTWRVDGGYEISRLGLQEYLVPGNVIVVEWADKFYDTLKDMLEEAGAKLVGADFEYTAIDKRNIKIYEIN